MAAASVRSRVREPPLDLAGKKGALTIETLAAAGIPGGSSYDGLVALEARAKGYALPTLDERARSTYRRLAVDFIALCRLRLTQRRPAPDGQKVDRGVPRRTATAYGGR